MVKRFTETSKWNDPWYRKLSTKNKSFWQYLCDQCDNAGVWKIDYEIASFYIGEEIDKADIAEINKNKERLIFLNEDLLLIRDFIPFQIGNLNSSKLTNLQKNCKVIWNKYKQAYPTITGKLVVAFKYKHKGKGKGIVKGKDKNKDNIIEQPNSFNLFCGLVLKDWNTLAESYPNLPKIKALSETRKDHLRTRFKDQSFVEGWPALIQAFKDSPWLRGDVKGHNNKPFKGGLDWLISNDTNFLKVLEGKYKDVKKTGIEQYIKEE